MTWNFRSRERKCLGTFVPVSENDVELSFPGAKMSWNSHSRERKRCGTFALSNRAYVATVLRIVEWSLFCHVFLIAVPVPDTIGSWKGLKFKVTCKHLASGVIIEWQ